jgi:hypothetical protein
MSVRNAAELDLMARKALQDCLLQKQTRQKFVQCNGGSYSEGLTNVWTVSRR